MPITNPNGARRCIECKKLRSLSNFELRSDTKTYRGNCKNCDKQRKSKWYQENKVSLRTQYIAKKYKLSQADYGELLSEHRNLCAICGKEETSVDGTSGMVKALAIDHCHETGKVRGLLCWRCNAMIGCAKESTETLRAAIRYLDKYGQ